jgi:hypothetical protein
MSVYKNNKPEFQNFVASPFCRAIALAVSLSGCAPAQVTSNANRMGSTIAEIQRDQVLRNISHAIDDRDFVPSGVVLGTGQANVSLGLTSTAKVTNINFAKPAFELDLAPTDTWTSQWQFTSITNQDDLRRLRNIYALIVATDAQYNTLEDYFRSRLSGPRSQQPTYSQNSSTGSQSDTVFRGLFEQLLPTQPPVTQKSPPQLSPQGSSSSQPTPQAGSPPAPPPALETPANQQIISWPQAKSYIVNGDSIGCRLYQSTESRRGTGLPFRRWLYWRRSGGQWLPNTPDPANPVRSLGDYGGWEIGVTSLSCFDDFVILVQGFTPVANNVSNQGPKLLLFTPP